MRGGREEGKIYGSYSCIHTQGKPSLATGSSSVSEIDVAVGDTAVPLVTGAGPRLWVSGSGPCRLFSEAGGRPIALGRIHL